MYGGPIVLFKNEMRQGNVFCGDTSKKCLMPSSKILILVWVENLVICTYIFYDDDYSSYRMMTSL